MLYRCPACNHTLWPDEEECPNKCELPPHSNRGVTFLTPPPKGQVFLPFCCQLREQMGILQEGMEEARRRWDDVMYNSNLEDWKGLYDQWMFERWCDQCKAEFVRVK